MTQSTLREKAKSYLTLCYHELNKQDLFDERWSEVENSISKYGTYELLGFELDLRD